MMSDWPMDLVHESWSYLWSVGDVQCVWTKIDKTGPQTMVLLLICRIDHRFVYRIDVWNKIDGPCPTCDPSCSFVVWFRQWVDGPRSMHLVHGPWYHEQSVLFLHHLVKIICMWTKIEGLWSYLQSARPGRHLGSFNFLWTKIDGPSPRIVGDLRRLNLHIWKIWIVVYVVYGLLRLNPNISKTKLRKSKRYPKPLKTYIWEH